VPLLRAVEIVESSRLSTPAVFSLDEGGKLRMHSLDDGIWRSSFARFFRSFFLSLSLSRSLSVCVLHVNVSSICRDEDLATNPFFHSFFLSPGALLHTFSLRDLLRISGPALAPSLPKLRYLSWDVYGTTLVAKSVHTPTKSLLLCLLNVEVMELSTSLSLSLCLSVSLSVCLTVVSASPPCL